MADEQAGIQYPLTDDAGHILQKAAGVESHTYGRFGSKGFAFDAPKGAETKRNFRWPFETDIIEGRLYLTGGETGDVTSCVVAPDLPLNYVVNPPNQVDVLAADIVAGDTQITLVPDFLGAFVNAALIDAGLWEIVVTDGVNTDGPVLVTGYDKATGIVTLGVIKDWDAGGQEPVDWPGFTHDYGKAALVLVTRKMIDGIELDGSTMALTFGQSARGAAPLPANVTIQIRYTNNGQADKRIRLSFDFLTGVPLQDGG